MAERKRGRVRNGDRMDIVQGLFLRAGYRLSARIPHPSFCFAKIHLPPGGRYGERGNLPSSEGALGRCEIVSGHCPPPRMTRGVMVPGRKSFSRGEAVEQSETDEECGQKADMRLAETDLLSV